jgi:imidazolonepropionase-like amidohydrolase
MLAIRVNQVFDGKQVVAGAGVIFVDEGRIIGIESTTADIPEECRVLDYPKAIVLPGLVDAHVHL